MNSGQGQNVEARCLITTGTRGNSGRVADLLCSEAFISCKVDPSSFPLNSASRDRREEP